MADLQLVRLIAGDPEKSPRRRRFVFAASMRMTEPVVCAFRFLVLKEPWIEDPAPPITCQGTKQAGPRRGYTASNGPLSLTSAPPPRALSLPAVAAAFASGVRCHT
jgi:hypothetical protein